MRLFSHSRYYLLSWEGRCEAVAQGKSIMTLLYPGGLEFTWPASPSYTSWRDNKLPGRPRGWRWLTRSHPAVMSNAARPDRHILLTLDKSTAVRGPLPAHNQRMWHFLKIVWHFQLLLQCPPADRQWWNEGSGCNRKVWHVVLKQGRYCMYLTVSIHPLFICEPASHLL